MKEFAMRPSRSPVLWFFVTTFVLTVIGHSVHLYVSHRLSIGVPSGTPILETPVWVLYTILAAGLVWHYGVENLSTFNRVTFEVGTSGGKP